MPGGAGADDTAKAVGAALGTLLSETVQDGMTVGVGWGRTLSASLATFSPPRRERAKIVSLLGGVVEVTVSSPLEFTWRLAPARRRLLPVPARCWWTPLKRASASSPAAGSTAGNARGAGPRRRQRRRHRHRTRLAVARTDLGGGTRRPRRARLVCDISATSSRRDGRSVRASAQRARDVDPARDGRRRRPRGDRDGGAAPRPAILAARASIGCNSLVTDEHAARRLLALTKVRLAGVKARQARFGSTVNVEFSTVIHSVAPAIPP